MAQKTPNAWGFGKGTTPSKRWLRKEPGFTRQNIGSRETLTTILLTVISATSVMLTYFGVSNGFSEQGATLVQKGQSLAFALSFGVLSWLGWYYLFGLVFRLTGKRLMVGLTTAFVYISSVAAVDAPFNMEALGGGQAVQFSLVDTAKHYEVQKDLALRNATILKQLLPAIETQAERFAGLKESELEHGTHSGSSGAGKVSAAFGQIETTLSSLARELEAGLGATTAVQAKILQELATLKTQAYTIGPLRDRMIAVSKAADALDIQFTRLTQSDYRSSLEVTLSVLEALFPEGLTAKSAFEEVQNRELQAIGEMATPVAMALREALVKMPSMNASVTDRIRPMSTGQAIRFYWRDLLPQWVAAMFIDFAPGMLLIILIAAYRETDIKGVETSGADIIQMEPSRKTAANENAIRHFNRRQPRRRQYSEIKTPTTET